MKLLLLALIVIFAMGFVLPEQYKMPVQGATAKNWNVKSFWYYPWGRSGTHKGIDIFAQESTPVVASTQG